MNSTPTKNLCSYKSTRGTILSGDLLLFRSKGGLFSRGIAALGRSIYSHAAMAAWWADRLFALETRSWIGGRALLLSNLVVNAPGRIDVFKTDLNERQREIAVDWMKSATGKKYGWGTIFNQGLRVSPIISIFLSPPLADGSTDSPPVCSELVSRAYREAGVDPVPRLSDRATLPGDLARSWMFKDQEPITLTSVMEDHR